MILVLGAQGFIGGYFMEALGDRALAVKVTDIVQPHQYITSDDWEWREFNSIVNLAALQPARGDFSPEQYIAVNVIGLLNILEWSRRAGIKKVLHCVSQKREFKGKYAMFSISEHCAMDCLEYYHQEYGMQTIALRLPPVYGYGPFLKGTGFMAFMEAARDGKPLEVWGNPHVKRDWIDVRDAVRAIIALIDSDAQGEYLVSGGLLGVREEAEIINQAWGNRSEIACRPEIDHGLKPTFAYWDMARIAPYWRPDYGFEDTVREIKRRMEVKE